MMFIAIIKCSLREFRDVVFKDVGLEHDSLLTLNNWRCGEFTSKADMGEGCKIVMFKPHILKHHIPEHPITGPQKRSRNVGTRNKCT